MTRIVMYAPQTEEYNTSMQFRRSAWRFALAAAVTCGALVATGCSCGKADVDPAFIGTFHMGQRVQVGPIIYTVLESEWRTALSEGGRAPKNRFLVLRVSITNSGSEAIAVPEFELMAENGTRYQEVTENVEGLANWLGMLRKVEPSATQQGAIVYDVPLGPYKLILLEGGDVEKERYAHVDIPVQLE